MNEQDLYAKLTDVFREVFGDDDMVLQSDLTADQVEGWDSIKMVTIIVAVEEKFGVRLRSREVDQLKNVGDLATLLQGKL